MYKTIVASITLIILATACASPAPVAPTLDINAINTSVYKTAWAPMTLTAGAFTATPTNTPLPTKTPRPTVTNTPRPEPEFISGAGDSVVDVKFVGPAIAHIKHAGYANFAVKNYGPNNDYIDLMVNTIGNYDGILPLNFLESEQTKRFEINADGSWEIKILPLENARIYEAPAQISGVGDDVLIIRNNPDVMKIETGQNYNNFAIWAYGANGRDLIVNEIAPYSGTVLVPNTAIIFTITSNENSWTIDVTGK